MRMRRLVDRHVVDIGFQIGAVIKIVASHQKLIRLALAAMQRHDQARHRLKQLARAICRRQLQFLLIDDAFARGRGRAEQLPSLRCDNYILDRVRPGTGGHIVPGTGNFPIRAGDLRVCIYKS
jgi:hypothetical protein